MSLVNITESNFEEEVVKSSVPVLVDFWAVWCGPCQAQGPVLEELAGENNKIKIGKINVDEEPVLAMKYGVSSIPTMILFKNGEAAERVVGLHSKDQLVEVLGL